MLGKLAGWRLMAVVAGLVAALVVGTARAESGCHKAKTEPDKIQPADE